MAHQLLNSGIGIEYEISGPPDGAPLLLIHGVGAQLVRWPEPLYNNLSARGFRVIRFDNRDAGLSTHIHEAGVPDFAAISAAKARGEPHPLPYTLQDLADDAFGLLDSLNIPFIHIVGVSLGGMIAQQMAIDAPERIRSMTIMMSQSSHPGLPPSDPAAQAQLSAPSPDPSKDLAGYLAHSVALNRALGSPLYPTSEADLQHFANLAVSRAYDPPGAIRQMAAAQAAPDRSEALSRLTVPTLVVHGVDDALVPLAAGEQLAQTIPASWLLAIRGMGHDIPFQLCDLFVSAIAANAARADGGFFLEL